MKIQRLLTASYALLISFSPLAVISPVFAAVDTCTWTGAVDGTTSNGGNWSGCDNGGVPENGDSLVFPAVALNKTINNDLVGMTFDTLTLTDGSGSYNLSGNSITVSTAINMNGPTFNGDPAIIGLGISLPAGIAVTVAASTSLKISGNVSGAGGITNSGAGVLILSGNNTNTGTTAINSGNVSIDGTQSSSAITVANNATLRGGGTIGTATVNTGGHLSPGSLVDDSTGGLYVACLNAGSGTTISGTYNVDIGGTTVCTDYDQLKVAGTVTLTGATLNTVSTIATTATAGQTFKVIDADVINGTFTGLAEGATFTENAVTYKISYVGGDVVLTVMATDLSGLGKAGGVAAPGTPDTGLGILTAHPLVTMLFTTVAAAGLFITARRYGYATAKIRK